LAVDVAAIDESLIDGEHVAFAWSILLLMWLHASNDWGLGRWWRAHTPTILN
jgi:thiosulfate dehydrogenase [quinone] large subunit